MINVSSDFQKESFKMMYDIFKHITTIDTGAIVIIATFFSKSFESTSKNWLVMVCVGTLIISLIACVIGMWGATLTMTFARDPKVTKKELNLIPIIVRGSSFFALFGFLAGVITLAVFIFVNVKV